MRPEEPHSNASTTNVTPNKTPGKLEPDDLKNLTQGHYVTKNEDEPLSPYMRAKREVSRPKKPLSAYIYFSQEYREKLKEEHPEWTSHDIMKHVSAKWAHMGRSEK